ncbi:hypothetical protein phiPsa374_132 [Pseudomonas phage phiPsa374]|uniref:Uncharacterized protein n=6 Tax=Otagovirus TaxID=2560197 RepID=A0A7G9V1L9_9CAUD|nr:hypothetical protein CF96_gp088 [Pseudomonas phage phiPsa374]YP_010766865.1 hypothetical protein QGX14_gp096 [Pseudomonas phage psageK4]YP_010767057.1 hypothetical protein QGX15_gp095 [Pseudomonas phage psageK4e]YP_010767397.1 hypothetical protein QGX17_gp090 [Pseudomonas phage phiPsa381]YP_010767572.1 hypothetical protein QGX18_gp092 [Pseudomonas phage phiPsa347]YP_010767922.1 hypothetical protein QGX20_gp086 [Pseudomonas phage phiPsa300]AHJ87392.1 hypothetical protein phiPsa374_132 [Pseu
MTRYKIFIERTYGTGWYDGDEYCDLEVRPDPFGPWYKVTEVDKLLAKQKDKMQRMQKYIDKLEGRA